jgi:NADPH:quinone reductase-like Zn-dependent oxidoreductase
VSHRRRAILSYLKAGVELVRGGIYHPFQLIVDNRAIAGVQVLLLWDDLPRLKRGIAQIFDWTEKGVVRPHVDRVLPLESAREAHRLLEGRSTRGKLLLQCSR